MARPWKAKDFDSLYERYVCQDAIQAGGREFYRRYRSRYKVCIQQFAALAPPHSLDVLDVGGGQLALMCSKLWNDRAVLADIPGPRQTHDYMREHGVETIHWNLCLQEAPVTEKVTQKFDVIFFSEVIEHLPIPGYIPLERLRKALKPGGILICTTPNLYRLRNVVCMALGVKIFEHFELPDAEHSLGHVLEYSREHLAWQFKKAGFKQCQIEYSQMHHSPTNPLLRPLAWLGYPLHALPRWRDNLLAVAYAPSEIK